MQLNDSQKKWLYFVMWIAILGFNIFLALQELRFTFFLIFVIPIASIFCYKCFSELLNSYKRKRAEALKPLWACLRKIEGLTIDNYEWDKDNTIFIEVTFRKLKYHFAVEDHSAIVYLRCLPFFSIKANDRYVTKVLECINQVNLQTARGTIVMTNPSDTGDRYVGSNCNFVLPSYNPEILVQAQLLVLADLINGFKHYINQLCPELLQDRTSESSMEFDITEKN